MNYCGIMRCGLSVPVVSVITWLWRVMTLMDLCLHDGVSYGILLVVKVYNLYRVTGYDFGFNN